MSGRALEEGGERPKVLVDDVVAPQSDRERTSCRAALEEGHLHSVAADVDSGRRCNGVVLACPDEEREIARGSPVVEVASCARSERDLDGGMGEPNGSGQVRP